MQFIFQYPDAHGTEIDMLDAGPVAELAVAAERAGRHGQLCLLYTSDAADE